MALPPPVTDEQAADAVRRIAERRRSIDDENASRLGEDPVDVLAYLRRYSSGIPQHVAEADVLDGLVLELYLWWLAAEAEWWLLERAKKLRMAPSRIGHLLGVTSRQGVHDRLRLAQRKVERLRGEPLQRGSATSSERTAEQEQVRWLGEHRSEIRAVAREAVSLQRFVGDEAAEWLVDVARDVEAGDVTPASFQFLRFALDEVAEDTACEDSGRGEVRDRLLERWAGLFARYPSGPRSAT